MKNNIHIQRIAILGLLAAGLGVTAVHAQQPKVGSPADIEKTDPFKKGKTEANPKTPENLSAELLDAQARILFARGETDKAIATQEQAVEKAKDDVLKYSATLARYTGKDPAQDGLLQKKLRSIIIPSVNMEDTSLDEAIDFLRFTSAKLDPDKKSINIVVRRPQGVSGKDSSVGPLPRIAELRLTDVSLDVVLKEICSATKYRMSVDESKVTLEPIVPQP